jgi:hypothetical protein
MEYKPLKEEYLFDVAVKLYGDAVIGVENILSLNVGLNLDNDLLGSVIIYNEARRRKPVFARVEKEKISYFYAHDYQSVYDISIQVSGSLIGLKDALLVHQNLNERVAISTEFKYGNASDPMVNYYIKNKLIAQTFIVSDTGEIAGIITETGINFITEDLSGNQTIIPE